MLFVLFFVYKQALYAQFQDDFTDADFINNPTWIGDMDSFEIDAALQLHLVAPANTQESYLVTPSLGAVDGEWSFYVQLDFAPSSTNKAYVYLISSESNLEDTLNGYFVMIGNTDDEVSLYKQSGNSVFKIIDGLNGTVANNPKVKIKVTRDILGNFELFTDTSATLNQAFSEGTVLDNTYLTSAYFGVRCDYTATRSDKFYFDDFFVSAQVFVDVTPPSLIDYEVLSQYSIKLFFSEPLNPISAQEVSNYSVNNAINAPSQATYSSIDLSVLLTFSSPFLAETAYALDISQVSDLANLIIDTTLNFTLTNAYPFQQVVFNELLADETPSFGLPTFEFVELKNLSADTLFTEGWFISDLTDTAFFNTDTILPNQHIILCSTTAKTFYDGFGKTIGLTSFISLNKSEDNLTLFNKYGQVLDSLHYFDTWYSGEMAPNNTPKVDGGWSLSRIVDSYPCSASGNWAPSNDLLGGSPGTQNSISITPGFLAPHFVSASFINDTTIQLIFDQEILGGLIISNYIVTASGSGFIIPQDITTITGGGTTYYITINTVVNLDLTYSVSLSNIQNCEGVPMLENSINVYFISPPALGDLVINEVLFNPYTGAQDYIEVYNNSKKAIDLNGLSFVEYHIDYQDSITDFSTPFSNQFILPPNAYFTFSEDTASVFLNYIVNKPDWLFQRDIPNLADTEGDLALVFFDSIVIDRLHYYSRWNFELLDTDNGVALERIKYASPSQDKDNWASAAASFGYGTPTAKNSQAFIENPSTEKVYVLPEVFTPNQDGIDDFALVHYQLSEAGFVANVHIFDAVGRKVKDLATKETIGAEGFWRWDGTNSNNEKAKIGIYIVSVDVFDLSGKKKHFEKTIVLGASY